MKYRQLGSSGFEVSVMAFGAWQLGDPTYWGEDEQAAGADAVVAATDAGINLFDTAEGYGAGESERALGRALRGRRDKVYIADKVSSNHGAPEQLRKSCEDSLRRLGTDYIDIYQVHWPFRDVSFEDAYAEMQRLKDEGKIRAVGVSNFGVKDLESWVAIGECVSDQFGYNMLFRAIEHEIVPVCRKHGVGILAYMPLMQGILAGRWRNLDDIPQPRRRTRHFSSTRPGTRHDEPGCEQLLTETLSQLDAIANAMGQSPADIALAWTMARPWITSIIVGGRNPAQVLCNVAAVDLELDGSTAARLDEITNPLKEHLGPNADMWCGEADCRIR